MTDFVYCTSKYFWVVDISFDKLDLKSKIEVSIDFDELYRQTKTALNSIPI